MSRINTNVSAMLSQRVLASNNSGLNTSLERLSTGLRINSGKDDPAGLIASERLRSEEAAIEAAIGNAERADQVISIAEGGLQEVSSLLTELQSLVGQSANESGLSEDEKEANQLQIDSILQTIDRISESTSFQGTKLLNGNFDFNVSNVSTDVSDFQINTAKLSANENREVSVTVTQSAQRAGLFLSTGGALNLADSSSTFTIEISGTEGSREFSFASGATLSDIADDINTFTDVTGVTASASGGGINLYSRDYGSDAFVSVDVVNDGGQTGVINFLASTDTATAITVNNSTFAAAENGSAIRDAGQDVGVIVNGVQATSDGLTAQINTDFLGVELTLSTSGAQSLGTIDAFTITGGGAEFNLGANVDLTNQVSIGIQSTASRKLGSEANGYLDSLASGNANNVVDGDLAKAQEVITDALDQVSSLRGRLGAFQKNTIGSTINSLSVALENTAAAESAIRDTDFAKETTEMTRSQILAQAATTSLALAKSQPQQVLSLLG